MEQLEDRVDVFEIVFSLILAMLKENSPYWLFGRHVLSQLCGSKLVWLVYSYQSLITVKKKSSGLCLYFPLISTIICVVRVLGTNVASGRGFSLVSIALLSASESYWMVVWCALCHFIRTIQAGISFFSLFTRRKMWLTVSLFTIVVDWYIWRSHFCRNCPWSIAGLGSGISSAC